MTKNYEDTWLDRLSKQGVCSPGFLKEMDVQLTEEILRKTGIDLNAVILGFNDITFILFPITRTFEIEKIEENGARSSWAVE